jgi:hypothetical protein
MAASNMRISTGIEIEGSAITTLILNGTADPSAASGIAADVGSMYMRDEAATDGGALWLKFGEDDTDWTEFASSGGGASAEDAFQNTFMGKSGLGSETPTYSAHFAVSQISDGDNLELAIATLDNAIGPDSNLSPLTRTVGQLVASEDLKQNVEDLDTVVGADSELTAVSRTTGPVSTANTIYANIDALDLYLGDDVSPTTRTVGPLVAANDVGANLEALDTAIGTDAQMTSVRTISTSNSVAQNLSDLDERSPVLTTDTAITSATTVDTVLVDDVDSVKWFVCATEVGTPANKECSEIYAVHDGTASADATAVDYAEYARLRSGAQISGLSFDVVLAGTAGTQTMGIEVTSTASVDVRVIRLDL